MLTTDHPVRSYGFPRLVVEAEDPARKLGPSDSLDGNLTAADVLAARANDSARSELEPVAARAFLRQWPVDP